MHAKSSKLQPNLPSPILLVMGIVLIGAVMRFWQLDAKALWLDEVIGALFSAGRRLEDIPLDQAVDLSRLQALFTVVPGRSCAQIAQTVATDSVHPPVYFCLMYRWMSIWQPDADRWVWVLRSLPALLGVVSIGAVYGLNRVAFSARAGLAAAALMAVSPFAVYLSQEARHYTLPMLLTLLSLTILVHMQRVMHQGRTMQPGWLVAWTGINSLGMYVHYFYLLVVLAQLGALAIATLWAIRAGFPTLKGLRRNAGRFGLSLTVLLVSYLPWLPTMLSHFSRPETDWLKPYKPDWSDRVAPLYQTVSSWLLMVIALPIEAQPLSVAVASAIAMLLIGGWILWRAGLGVRHLWQEEQEVRSPLLLLGSFVLCVLAQFFGITYILDKDVTSVPRYAFVYYPGLVALLGAGLADPLPGSMPSLSSWRRRLQTPLSIALMTGLLSSALVVYGLVFQKGYYPHQVAQEMAFERDRPILLVVSYQSLQEVGLGLSFALELQNQYPDVPPPPVRVAFMDRSDGFGPMWRSLSRLEHPLPLPLNLWAVASPGMKTRDYPETLKLRRPNRRGRVTCTIDPDHFNRIGFPYQLFRCSARRG